MVVVSSVRKTYLTHNLSRRTNIIGFHLAIVRPQKYRSNQNNFDTSMDMNTSRQEAMHDRLSAFKYTVVL
jgi:tRNA(Leu) C34 or U34 (ribose-2'-O)-methylase TrmL